jgi:hypothetical protein
MDCSDAVKGKTGWECEQLAVENIRMQRKGGYRRTEKIMQWRIVAVVTSVIKLSRAAFFITQR